MMKKYFAENKKFILIKVLIILGVLAIDIITKIVFAEIFSNRYASGNNENIDVIKGVVSFTYTENTGAAFSMLSGNVILLIIATIIFISLFVWYDVVSKDNNALSLAAFSLIVGGAIGNLIDRIFLGYVRDYISFDIVPNFAICNFADVCITIGCACYILHLILLLAKSKRSKGGKNEV